MRILIRTIRPLIQTLPMKQMFARMRSSQYSTLRAFQTDPASTVGGRLVNSVREISSVDTIAYCLHMFNIVEQ